jgi:MFS family permease
MGGLTMYGVYICNVALINSIFPKSKGLVMGIMFGTQGIASIFMAPLLTYCIDSFNVGMVLVVEGALFAGILFAATMLVHDPTRGDRKLVAQIQKQADEEEYAAAIAGKTEETLPTMRWKKAFTHPAFYYIFFSIVTIQMIGNVLVTDIPVLGERVYDVSEMDSAWVVSAFGIGAGLGGIVIGFLSDKIGPYRTTFWLGIIDGILLLGFVLLGADNFMAFGVICVVQGFTYNGMTTLNPIMITDAYSAKDLGTMMGFVAISYAVVGAVGPQIGLSMPFVPMIICCAVLSVVGGFLSKLASSAFNKYYTAQGSKCVVR